MIGILLTFLTLARRSGHGQAKIGCQQKNQSPHRSIVTLKSGVGRQTSEWVIETLTATPRDFSPEDRNLKSEVSQVRDLKSDAESGREKELLHGGCGAAGVSETSRTELHGRRSRRLCGACCAGAALSRVGHQADIHATVLGAAVPGLVRTRPACPCPVRSDKSCAPGCCASKPGTE